MRAFTLIELLIVISITVAIATVGAVNFINYRNRQNFKINAQELVAVLRSAQNRSMTQESGAVWGVYFSNPAGPGNDFYDLFLGADYNPSAVVARINLPGDVRFDIPASGSSLAVIFSLLTGFPNSSTVIRMASESNPSIFGAIIINTNGQIQY